MKIVNPHLANSIEAQGKLSSPNSYGYFFLAAELKPSKSLFKIRLTRNIKIEIKNKTTGLNNLEGIRRIDLFSRFIIPPGSREGLRYLKEKNINLKPAKFDLVILIETESINQLESIIKNNKVIEIQDYLKKHSSLIYKTKASNKMRIGEVNKDRKGIFLFNFFYCNNEKTLLDVWKYTAGWWTAKANLTNSTPLSPFDDQGPFRLINHCSWNRLADILPVLVLGRLGIIKGLNSFVLKNFTANKIVAMPILYKKL